MGHKYLSSFCSKQIQYIKPLNKEIGNSFSYSKINAQLLYYILLYSEPQLTVLNGDKLVMFLHRTAAETWEWREQVKQAVLWSLLKMLTFKDTHVRTVKPPATQNIRIVDTTSL